MKSLLKNTVLFLALLSLNCSNNYDSDNSSQEFAPELLNGTWRISLFTDESSDRTQEFNGYEFTFDVEEEAAIVALNSNSATAYVEVFQDTNDNNEDIWVVYTDFDNNPGDADLNDLVEDWFVTGLNGDATVIQFEELFSNSAPEILHLTKVNDN